MKELSHQHTEFVSGGFWPLGASCATASISPFTACISPELYAVLVSTFLVTSLLIGYCSTMKGAGQPPQQAGQSTASPSNN